MTRDQGGGEQHGISQQLPLNQQIHKISLITRDLYMYIFEHDKGLQISHVEKAW